MNDTRVRTWKANISLGLFSVLFGLAVIAVALVEKYPIWSKSAPGRGLFPILAGSGILLCGLSIAVTALLAYRKERSGSEPAYTPVKTFELFNLAVVLIFAVLVALLCDFLGFLPCVTIATIFYVKLLAHETWVKSLLVGLGTGLVMYLTFVLFLKVHFPIGFLGI